MITANEAREKTESVRQNGVKREMERIEYEVFLWWMQDKNVAGQINMFGDGFIN